MFDPDSPLRPGGGQAPVLPQAPAQARFAEDRLRLAVLWCEIAPGATVTEAEVMARFGLTRAAARVALAQLGHEGWALAHPRAGWEILPVTGRLIGQVLAARRLIEPGALAELLLAPQQQARLSTLARMIEAVQRQGDPAARSTLTGFVQEIETILLGGTDPFTAGHLRQLWQHAQRIARHLGVDGPPCAAGTPALIAAILAGQRETVPTLAAARIDTWQELCLHEMLRNETVLGPGSGSAGADAPQNAAPKGRPT